MYQSAAQRWKRWGRVVKPDGLFADMMRRARIFNADREEENAGPLVWAAYPEFVLPFPVCGVVRPSGLIVLIERNSDGDQEFGLYGSWAAIAFSVGFQSPDRRGHPVDLMLGGAAAPWGANGQAWKIEGGELRETDASWPDVPGKSATEILEAQIRATLQFFLRVQSPRQRTVKLMPESKPRVGTAGKSKRPTGLGERPIYLSLTDTELRKYVGQPEPTGRKLETPHQRRAHMRRLASGRVVPVRATWVGPLEGRTPGGREYQILTD